MRLTKLIHFIAIVILTASSVVTQAAAKDGTGPVVGKPAPILYGRTLDDELYRLNADTGQAKVINFFWVECHPCRDEMPELARLEKEYKQVKFISVHTALYKHEVEPETVEKFLKTLKGHPSNIVLTKGVEIGKDFNIIGLPHTLILDANNVVLMNISGYDKSNMQRLAKALQSITKP